MYADTVTDSMRRAIDETNRRRQIQMAYNEEHGIVPSTIVHEIRTLTQGLRTVAEPEAEYVVSTNIPKDELHRMIGELEKQMKRAAQDLEFEKAALLRDQILELRRSLSERDEVPEWERYREYERQRG